MKYKRIIVKRKNKRIQLFKFFIFVFIIFFIIIMIDGRVRPLIKSSFTYQAKTYAMKVINEVIADEMCNQSISYDNIVKVSKNEEGNITSIQANTIEINKLNSNISNSLTKKLVSMEKQKVTVPVGTLFAWQIFSGRGPNVSFVVQPMGYVQTEIYNNFLSAGINQTLHQIMLKTSVTVSVVFPGYSITTDVVTNYCLAETVVVGYVPESYVKFDGNMAYDAKNGKILREATKGE